jgi:hypothetical protein
VPVDDCSENVHAWPDCKTLTDCPAIVKVAVRAVTPAFAATPTVIVPLPDAAFGAGVAHASVLDAVHPQLRPFAVTPTVPVPPDGPNGPPSADVSSVTLHAAAACEIVNDWPPITIDPDRGVVAEFDGTLNNSVPGPVPDAPDSIVTQFGDAVVA